MKKTLAAVIVSLSLLNLNSKAQSIVNPQVLPFKQQKTHQTNLKTKALVGYCIGGDGRFGGRFYFQPGLFYGQQSFTQYSTIDSSLTVSDVDRNLNRNIFTIKTFAGFDLVHKDGFKLRVNGGPSVDFITKTKNEDGTLSKDDVNSTIFNARLGAGVDIWFLSFDIGYSWGLTDAFTDNTNADNSTFNTLYITAGVVFKWHEKIKSSFIVYKKSD